MSEIKKKIDHGIKLLREMEGLALDMDERGFHLAFSGGKDSQVLYHVAQMSGVKFHAEMSVTTLDPPELMKFVRSRYADVKLNRPEMNFYELIKKKKQLPLRHVRYCCDVLKEQAGAGSCTLIGIRKAESTRRAKRNEIEVQGRKFSGVLDQFNIDKERVVGCVQGKDKVLISPIIDLTDREVWKFIRDERIETCDLYNQGYHRIGCMFCPMASVKSKRIDMERYPKVADKIIESIRYCIDHFDYGRDQKATAEEMFYCWISNQSFRKYFSDLRHPRFDFKE